ncbi:hypothetical protein HZA98_00960 [Candidatus Woesearchaeota archaeon]|nr:hypothetical protein [Candidatus Woesearchaeota archaeon]
MKALLKKSRREYVLPTGEIIKASQLHAIDNFVVYKEDLDAALEEYRGSSQHYYSLCPAVGGVRISIFERREQASSFSFSCDVLEYRNNVYVDSVHGRFVRPEDVGFLATRVLKRNETLENVLAEERKRLLSEGKGPTHYNYSSIGLVEILHVMKIPDSSFSLLSDLYKAAK